VVRNQSVTGGRAQGTSDRRMGSYGDRIYGYGFSENHPVAFEDRELKPTETQKDLAIVRNAVEATTDWLRNDYVDMRKIRLPYDKEVLLEFQGQTACCDTDTDTKILTKRGWLRWDHPTVGDDQTLGLREDVASERTDVTAVPPAPRRRCQRPWPHGSAARRRRRACWTSARVHGAGMAYVGCGGPSRSHSPEGSPREGRSATCTSRCRNDGQPRGPSGWSARGAKRDPVGTHLPPLPADDHVAVAAPLSRAEVGPAALEVARVDPRPEHGRGDPRNAHTATPPIGP